MALQSVTIENTRFIYRNWTGKEGPYNREGERDFSVVLTPEIAESMARDGWNVKTTKPRDEEDEPVFYLPVAVSFKFKAPRVTMINQDGDRVSLALPDERGVHKLYELEDLDNVDVAKVDLIVNPSRWTQKDGSTGIKAYLEKIFVIIEEDALERKYGR
jgi:hypothetical protein